jgi:hypothetical protein
MSVPNPAMTNKGEMEYSHLKATKTAREGSEHIQGNVSYRSTSKVANKRGFAVGSTRKVTFTNAPNYTHASNKRSEN